MPHMDATKDLGHLSEQSAYWKKNIVVCQAHLALVFFLIVDLTICDARVLILGSHKRPTSFVN